MIDLDTLQAEVGLHVDRLWPEEDIRSATLSLAEEAGEVCRAIQKRHHRRRGTQAEWTEQVRLETAQVVGVCLDIARREGFSLEEALLECVDALADMDPDHDPVGSSK